MLIGNGHATPNVRAASPTAVPVTHARHWWPATFVVAALLLLAIVPLIVDREATRFRDELSNGTQRARVAVNDLEAAFGSQLVANGSAPVQAHLEMDQADLQRVTPHVGPDAQAKLDTLERLLARWNVSPHDIRAGPVTAVQARQIFAAADRLDAYFTSRAQLQGVRVRRIEQIDLISALILVPIALVAIGFVVVTAERVRTLARIAERERAEVVRSAEARAALLRGVTHDVKNPLAAAAGYAQLLEQGIVGTLSPAQSDMVRRINRLVQSSVATVTDLLELARADGGDLRVALTRADLGTLVDETVADHRGLAQEYGLTVRAVTRPTPVTTDPLRVRQILSNLLSNAIKYTPRGGSVSVMILRDPTDAPEGEPRVGVEISDTGPGIPDELRSRLFEEFFRARSTESMARGNGLGLAISLRLARALGGDLVFRDQQPHGAVFTFWLDPAASRQPRPGETPSTHI